MPRLGRTALSCTLAVLLACGAAYAKPPAKQAAAKPAAKTQKAAAPATKAAPAPSTAPPPATVDPNLLTLEAVSGMAAAGAPHLALGLMDQKQPHFSADPVGWMSWERSRIYIYQGVRDWRAVIHRSQILPKGVPADFIAWEDMQAADAWLHLGDGAEARDLVQPLIWGGAAPPSDRDLSALRQLLVRSYLADKKLGDAQTAVIRYRQDYPKDAGDWPLLEARLFLRTDQAPAALEVLDGVKGPEADMLSLLAALRAGATAPDVVLARATRVANDPKAPEDERVHAWLIAAEANGVLKNPVPQIASLQNALALQPGLIDQDDIFVLDPGTLWDAYVTYGEALGNQLQLVMGDDQGWFMAASERQDKDPVGACALYSVEAYQAADPQQRDVAHWQFSLLMHKQPGGGVLLRHLYLHSDRFKDVPAVPPGVRYLLVPDVLELPDIPLASKLMQGLDAPPNGTDPAAWQLQRARVFILGGDTASGVDAMHQLLNAAALAPVSAPAAASAAAQPKPAARVDTEELLQVLFDMQTLHKDKEALPFFEQLLETDLTPDERRQMLYWTADSYRATGQYRKAAELYLRSAMLPGPFTMDPWAQTARYQAAGMLAKAGLIEDARNLYKGLLNATRDAAQQAVLEHDLQQLGLMPAAGANKD